jgi:protochlorophyllide reductase
MPDQRGRVVLITGANSGLGLESARALAARGCTVLLGCRTRAKADAACRSLEADCSGALDGLELDLADLESVQAAARQVRDRYGRLDLLLANAGVMAPPPQRTRQGFELQFGVNHLGHYLLTRLLLPLLQDQPGARVVQSPQVPSTSVASPLTISTVSVTTTAGPPTARASWPTWPSLWSCSAG